MITGLAVMRLAPLHLGHIRIIIGPMIESCDIAIIGLGDSPKNRTRKNPFTTNERICMIQNVFGDRIHILPLKDIGAKHPPDWCSYVFQEIKKNGLLEPLEYFTGSKDDAKWYSEHFFSNKLDFEPKPTHFQGEKIRKLNLLNRETNNHPSATEIREMIEKNDESWKVHVPRVNWKIVEDNYPKEFREIK